MAVMASDGPSPHAPSLRLGLPTPSKPRLSPAVTMSDDTLSALTPPLHCLSCSLQSLLKLSLLSLRPSLLQFVSIVSFLINHGNPICEPVCLPAFAFLIEMNFSLKSLFAIWSLSPQPFHCDYYFYLNIVSWQCQKYSTILILVLCHLCVTPLGCSFSSCFAPSSPFFSS